MPVVRSSLLAASAATLVLLAGAAPAAAVCKTMGFTVNDYGKDGPTKDAKDLLDKEIAKWATDNGVAKYTVGKKTVKCELFLDVILFDEHTCTATASVCWGEGAAAPKPRDAATKGEAKEKAAAAPASTEKPVETGTINEDSPPVAVQPPAKPAAAQDDAAERAAAAAERAAAAAERAAAAAEKAASSGATTEAAAGEQGSATDSGAPTP